MRLSTNISTFLSDVNISSIFAVFLVVVVVVVVVVINDNNKKMCI